MKCPLCAADAAEGALECPSCGVIFAKLKKRADREAGKAAGLLDTAPAKTPWAFLDSKAKRRAIALAVVAAWTAAVGLAVRRSLRRAAAGRGAVPETVLFRDPETGRTRELTVQRAPTARPRPAASRPPPPPDKWESAWLEDASGRRIKR